MPRCSVSDGERAAPGAGAGGPPMTPHPSFSGRGTTAHGHACSSSSLPPGPRTGSGPRQTGSGGEAGESLSETLLSAPEASGGRRWSWAGTSSPPPSVCSPSKQHAKDGPAAGHLRRQFALSQPSISREADAPFLIKIVSSIY